MRIISVAKFVYPFYDMGFADIVDVEIFKIRKYSRDVTIVVPEIIGVRPGSKEFIKLVPRFGEGNSTGKAYLFESF